MKLCGPGTMVDFRNPWDIEIVDEVYGMGLVIKKERWQDQTCESCEYQVSNECRLMPMIEGKSVFYPRVTCSSGGYENACSKWERQE